MDFFGLKGKLKYMFKNYLVNLSLVGGWPLPQALEGHS